MRAGADSEVAAACVKFARGGKLGLGNTILPRAREAYAARLATWEAWEGVSNTAMGEPRKTVVPWIEQLIHATPDQA